MADDVTRSADDWLRCAQIADDAGRTSDSWRALVRMCTTAAQERKSTETTGSLTITVTRRKLTGTGPVLTPLQLASVLRLCRREMNEKRRVLRYFFEIADSGANGALCCAASNLFAAVDSEMQLMAADVDAIVMQCASDDQYDLECSSELLLLSGDVWRYLTELACGEKRRESAKKSLKAYKKCWSLCKMLSPAHETRLACALNGAVLYYEILNNCDYAAYIARNATQAIEASDGVLSDQATLLRDALKANVDVWKGNAQKSTLEFERLTMKQQAQKLRSRTALSSSSENVTHI